MLVSSRPYKPPPAQSLQAGALSNDLRRVRFWESERFDQIQAVECLDEVAESCDNNRLLFFGYSVIRLETTGPNGPSGSESFYRCCPDASTLGAIPDPHRQSYPPAENCRWRQTDPKEVAQA
jgi:hypothetical protein